MRVDCGFVSVTKITEYSDISFQKVSIIFQNEVSSSI